MLGLVEYVKKLAPVLEMCDSLVSIDCNSANLSDKLTQRNFAVDLYAKLRIRLLSDASSSIVGKESDFGASPFTALFHQYQRYLQKQEAAVRAQLLPPPRTHTWYIPPLEFMVRSDRAAITEDIGSSGVHSVASSKNAFAPEDEQLVAEHLLLQLTYTIGSKNVRLTNSNGSEHVVLKRCIDAEEVHRVVQLWWELFVQHESAVSQRQLAKRLSERARASASTKNTVDELQEIAPADELSAYETHIVSHKTLTTSSTLSWGAFAILKRINELLKIDLSCDKKEYLRRLIAWLSDELQLIYEVTKPGDYAFSAVRRYYCPHHPYEVSSFTLFKHINECICGIYFCC